VQSGVVDAGGWVAPAIELIYEQGTPEFRGQWPRIESLLELAASRRDHGDWAHPALALAEVPSRRARRDAWGATEPDPAEPPIAPGVLHDNAAGRVAALDGAGVALQLISPGPTIDACLQLPSDLAAALFAAYNRYAIAYCRDHSQRLGAVLQLHGSEPRWSAQEVADLSGEPSVRAVSICLAVKIAPDDRHFDPLWDALESAGLPLLHRPSFCARVWTPGRLLAYLRAAGVLERRPGLQIGFAALDADLRSRLLAVEGGNDVDGALLWASEFPLCGSLRAEVTLARHALGERAEEVLVATPRRFLDAGYGPRAGSSRH
jgi:hypothetical protein